VPEPGTYSNETVWVAPDYLADFSRNACRQGPYYESHLCAKVRCALHIGECLHLASIDKIASPPEIAPGCPRSRNEMVYDSIWLVNNFILGKRDSVTHVHVIVIIGMKTTDLVQS